MLDLYALPRLGFRHWLAWQLVQIAWYIHHDEYTDEIVLLDGDEEVAAWGAHGDAWGGGWSYQFVKPGFKYGVKHRMLDEDDNVIDEWRPE